MAYIGAFSSVSYSEHLGMLHADSLQLRRLKSDLTLIYRIVHGLGALDFQLSLHCVIQYSWASDEINETVQTCLLSCIISF